MTDLETFCWPFSRLGEALQILGQRSDFTLRPIETSKPPEGLERNTAEVVNRWLLAAGGFLGLEVEPVEVSYADIDRLLLASGPTLIRLQFKNEPCFLALLGRRRGRLMVLGPDQTIHRTLPDLLSRALRHELEAPLAKEINQLLHDAGVPMRRQSKARAAILLERLSSASIGGIWLLRPSPSSGFWHRLRLAGLPRLLISLCCAHGLQYLLWLLSWWVIGLGALQGRLDQGWLLGWGLILLTLVPLRLLVTWLQGLISIGAGALLKQRLLYGATRLEPDEIRHQGAGQLLGRIIESEAIEALALSGGFLALVAAIELFIAVLVLGAGAQGWLHALLLVAWILLTLLVGGRYFFERDRWTKARLSITNDLVERMVGHRTRLAQQPPEQWHDGEDQALARYLGLSRVMDRTSTLLLALAPRGWLLLGLIGLTPAFVSGSASQAYLAVSLGGLLLAYQAFDKLAQGLSHLAGAAISWKQISAFFHAALGPEVPGLPAFALGSRLDGPRDSRPALEAHDLVFRYRDHAEPVLSGVSLRLNPGERMLLEGPSGSGKSTLVSLMIGLRQFEAGLLLLGGLDRGSLGSEGWRKRVVAAPQFHENHVLAETFAFNLLMGRHWPASVEDFEEALAICHELGLGDLLSRMPAGLLQIVGETGWQLSHGERSRLYIARALLQQADVVILDESFAALDPESLRNSMRCVLNRAPTLLVIAHP